MVDCLGRPQTRSTFVIQGVTRRTSLDSGGGASTLTGYSSNGYVASVTDYKGVQTTYVRNALGLETSRTEAAGSPPADCTESRCLRTVSKATSAPAAEASRTKTRDSTR